MSDSHFAFRYFRSKWLLLAAILAMLSTAAQPARAQTESVLYSFTGGADGGLPVAGLVLDAKGNLNGTTTEGGLLHNGCGSAGCGTVFEVTPAGSETVLYSFTGKNGDGRVPESSLTLDKEGNLYGTTVLGGNSRKGTVFELTPSGTETVLYSFAGGLDGAFPGAGLVRDAMGTFYGDTLGGGLHYDGAVFELAPSGAETVLFSFQGKQDGSAPGAALIRAPGILYGAASDGGGGSGCAPPGCGVIFAVTPTGTGNVLYRFTGGADGARPAGALVRDAQGNFFGTTAWGGTLNSFCPQGCGTVFELSPGAGDTWSLTVLHSFSGQGDGYHPVAGLLQDARGNLFGTTSGDACSGVSCNGTVFEITPTGAENVLHTFAGGADGQYPYGTLVQDKKGNLYGTTERGGAFGNGTVFKVTM
ncbi:MAG: choice-of-anchor tandem repeat GloVer-containing protein [Terriglobales bacterium]